MQSENNNQAEVEGGAPFNMAMIFYINLNKLIEFKDKAYLDNDLEAWYKGLNRIFNKLFKISEAERDALGSLFDKARKELLNREPGSVETLHLIDSEEVRLMNKYNMIMPKIENKSGSHKLNERYNIDLTREADL